MEETKMNFFELKNVSYSYDQKSMVLTDISATFERGKIYSILGKSGCGKTTLLSLMGGLAYPTKGELFFQGEKINRRKLTKFRAQNISIVFQEYNLIDYLNAKENAELTSNKKADKILYRLGLREEEIKRNVLKLSGGQQQRVAIARSLLSDTPLLLADEPTGNLDVQNSIEIAKILQEAAHKFNKCVIVVTHSSEVAQYADIILEIKGGILKELPV